MVITRNSTFEQELFDNSQYNVELVLCTSMGYEFKHSIVVSTPVEVGDFFQISHWVFNSMRNNHKNLNIC